MSPNAREDLFEVELAAPYIKHAKSTMNRWRTEGCGPPYIKLGRKVFYRRADLDAFLDSRIVNSTSEADARHGGGK
jgi:hypothetical protein